MHRKRKCRTGSGCDGRQLRIQWAAPIHHGARRVERAASTDHRTLRSTTTLHGARRVATSRNDAPRSTAGQTGRIDGPQNTEEHDESPLVATTHYGILRVATTYPSVTAYYSGLPRIASGYGGVRRATMGSAVRLRTDATRHNEKNPARPVILRDSFQKPRSSGLSGEDEIRTRGTGYPVRRFSKPVVSATHPPLRKQR